MTEVLIQELIDKLDTFEVVRLKIVQLLKENVIEQMRLATEAAKDHPELWKLRIFEERANPWEEWIDERAGFDISPIVNIWYDNSSFHDGASNLIERQKATGTYNIDCYGYGKSSETVDGHSPGDKAAALEAQRAFRLVRNILMSSYYMQLELQGLVIRRWPQSANMFQPQIDSRPIQKVVGSRLTLAVDFNEFSPQYQGPELELISTVTAISDDQNEDVLADYPK